MSLVISSLAVVPRVKNGPRVNLLVLAPRFSQIFYLSAIPWSCHRRPHRLRYRCCSTSRRRRSPCLRTRTHVCRTVSKGRTPIFPSIFFVSFQLAHLAVIDALMLAHLRNIVTVERVVESVSRQTSVDDRERPMDSADALLFWINKICLLVRDDVEQSQIILKG